MDFEALRAFVAVAETGSFTRAAAQIYLTQPAVSKRIGTLEAELGTRLFDRIGHGIHLTEAGRTLLVRAQTILSQVEDAKRSLPAQSGPVSGELSMATSHHVGLHRLPAVLKRFHEAYPAVSLDLHFMDSEVACAAIQQGQLELAVVTLPPRDYASIERVRVWDDPLEIVVGRSHPLARRTRIKPTNLVEYPAILPGPGTYTREIVLAALAPIRHELNVVMSTNYLEVLKMLAGIGLGWSALPRTMIDDELKVVHIDRVHIRRELGIVLHRARTLSNAGQAMIATIKEDAS
ncbi:MAG: LysR family transcriptional regulator [Proteobacteria bacterium]|nr:MAG: LysR family transcriptional regulator [Pseudomonadota bacterium]TDJ71054.1 MAG: LysR family transcriptional regulator [Pseudomonadota bacterium]